MLLTNIMYDVTTTLQHHKYFGKETIRAHTQMRICTLSNVLYLFISARTLGMKPVASDYRCFSFDIMVTLIERPYWS